MDTPLRLQNPMDSVEQQSPGSEEIPSEAASLRKSLRPVLIVSERNVVEHTTFVRHLLVGLVDESIPVALIGPPGCDLESVVPAPAALFLHPSVDLPLMEHVGLERLAGRLEKIKPTVLHCLCETRAALARRLARRLDIPYVLTINSLLKRRHRLSLSPGRCARIVVPSEAIGSGVRKALPSFSDRIRQINIGTFVENDNICFSNLSRLPSIIMAHPLHRVADFEHVFQAARSLQAEGREFMLAVMGSGPAEHRLRKLLTTLGLTDTVTIVPILDPWRAVLAAADIFVQPRPLEAFSVFLLEAMAAGTAVAACWGGVDDLIVPDQTAVLFEPDSEPSVRQALKRLLDGHDFARRLALTAQEHVRACHSASKMIAATLNVYAEIQPSRKQ